MRDETNTMSEIKNPTAPAIIKITPNVDNLNPCCCTIAELCAVVAKYMIAPVTADIALKTIPGKPMTSPLMLKSLVVAPTFAKDEISARKTLRGIFRFTAKSHERLSKLEECIKQCTALANTTSRNRGVATKGEGK